MLYYKNTEIVRKVANKLLRNPFITKLFLPNKYKRMIAFTLAEILLTLLIIGIVASIIIPGLINNIQNAELKVAWKNTYSIMNQATKLVLLEVGGSMKGILPYNIDDSPSDEFKNFYIKHLINFKECPKPVIGPCWSSEVTRFASDNLLNDNAGIILSNGAFVLFDYENADCDDEICAFIDIDVNGLKGPNKIGKDIFGIKVLENKILPWGTKNDGYENTCNTTGISCSSEYLK